MAAARAQIAALALQGPPESKAFDNLWKPYKAAFSQRQHGKCGYCEGRVTGFQAGDVEHYRPKALLQELPSDPSRWGTEQPHSSQVKGRAPVKVSDWGYHWLAYEWNNYLLACECCNRQWKKNFFPVQEIPRRVPPDPAHPEVPLLLNPFDDPDPLLHLHFDELGQVTPFADSAYGRATIDTCGLDRRESLRQSRAEKAREVHQNLRIFDAALDNKEAATAYAAGQDLLRAGQPEGSHPGMVRAIVAQRIGLSSWDEFAPLLAALAAVVGQPRQVPPPAALSSPTPSDAAPASRPLTGPAPSGYDNLPSLFE